MNLPDVVAATGQLWQVETADWFVVADGPTTTVRLPASGVALHVGRPEVGPDRVTALQTARSRLAAAAVPVVPLLPSTSGATWETVEGRVVEVERWVEHDGRMNMRSRLRAGAALLARVHDAWADLDLGVAGEACDWANWISPDEVVAGCARAARCLSDWGLGELAADVVHLAELTCESPALPTQVVHGDFWDNNVYVRAEQLVAVTDFDESSRSTPKVGNGTWVGGQGLKRRALQYNLVGMGLEDVRRRFFQHFPNANLLDKALTSTDNPTPAFFLSMLNDNDLKGVGLALVRLGRDLERRFSINGEVAVFFVPWEDFQRRSFNAISGRVLELARDSQIGALGSERFTPTKKVALVVSRDRSLDQKLDEWQQDTINPTVVIPIRFEGARAGLEIRASITHALKARLGDRDLYRTQNPVTGDEFFGRTGMIRDLAAAVFGDENIAVLGLRRSGKTSVIRELKRQLLPRGVVMAIADFQMLESGSVDEVAESIASNLLEELKIARRSGMDTWVGSDAEQEWRGISLASLRPPEVDE